MEIESFRTYCLEKKGVSESFPFDADTLVFKVLGKMFALAPLNREPKQVNLKCDPLRAEDLRDAYPEGVLPGYHMSKKHWNTIVMANVPYELLLELIDHSYDLVVAKLPKKQREALARL